MTRKQTLNSSPYVYLEGVGVTDEFLFVFVI